MAKRVTLKIMRAYDASHDSSLVRELEMAVDALTKSDGYSVQFWRDVELYGLREALIYLKEHVGFTDAFIKVIADIQSHYAMEAIR